MRLPISDGELELVRGDIVTQEVDAIVNAANESLLGGSGVDGAIHRAAGPELVEECRTLLVDAQGRRCPTGEVRVTQAYRLPSRIVIHGVGPRYDESDPERSAALLRSVHQNALAAARERECKSIAFPAISTGVFGYPMDEAARIAVGAAAEFLRGDHGTVDLVRFVLFSEDDLMTFDEAVRELEG